MQPDDIIFQAGDTAIVIPTVQTIGTEDTADSYILIVNGNYIFYENEADRAIDRQAILYRLGRYWGAED